MENNSLLTEITKLKDFIEIKEQINRFEVGDELDEEFALAFLGMDYVGEPREVEIAPGSSVETNYVSSETGDPLFLPNLSTDENLVVMYLKEVGQNFEFELREGKFKVPYEDKAIFEGYTLGEAVMKALLFGKAIEESEVSL